MKKKEVPTATRTSARMCTRSMRPEVVPTISKAKKKADLKSGKSVMPSVAKSVVPSVGKSVVTSVEEEKLKEVVPTISKAKKEANLKTGKSGVTSVEEEKVKEVVATISKAKKKVDLKSGKSGVTNVEEDKVKEVVPTISKAKKKANVKTGKSVVTSVEDDKEKEVVPTTSKTGKSVVTSVKEEKENEVVPEAPPLGIDEFYNTIKDKCVLSERWIVNEPRIDIYVKQPAILVIEVDCTMEGDLRIKRCVKILEDRSFRVLIDNVDMTHLFDLNKKVLTTQDVDKLLYTVLMKKVCQGLRTYDPLDPMFSKANYPVRQRGKLWYSKDCAVIVQKVFMGNSCSACQRIRNQMKRRFQTESRRKQQAKPAIKLVKSSFGKALYSALNDFSGKGAIPPSQYPRENMVYDEKLEVHLNRDLQNRIFLAATMPPPPPPPPKASRSSNKKRRKSAAKGAHYSHHPTLTTSQGQAIPVQEFITEDGQVCYVTNVLDHNVSFQNVSGYQNSHSGDPLQWGQMVIEKYEPPDLEEIMTMNEHGNIIIQNIQGEEFTLAEGEEYELIGEAQPATDPIEILPADNQQIQIIEVDEETMEQIGIHGSMDNMQIAHVDPNDPNLSQLLRAFQNQGLSM